MRFDTRFKVLAATGGLALAGPAAAFAVGDSGAPATTPTALAVAPAATTTAATTTAATTTAATTTTTTATTRDDLQAFTGGEASDQVEQAHREAKDGRSAEHTTSTESGAQVDETGDRSSQEPAIASAPPAQSHDGETTDRESPDGHSRPQGQQGEQGSANEFGDQAGERSSHAPVIARPAPEHSSDGQGSDGQGGGDHGSQGQSGD